MRQKHSTKNNIRSNPIFWVVFLSYLAVVVKIILLKNPRFFLQCLVIVWKNHGHSNERPEWSNTVPFRTINSFLNNSGVHIEVLKNVVGNILIFIPLGILLSLFFSRPYKFFPSILLSFLLSAFFEFVQLHTGSGHFDVDDIILNTAGGILGALLYQLVIVFVKPSKMPTAL